MCHLILALPVLGILVFWIFPLQIALPLYIIIFIISTIIYSAVIKLMKIPVKTGIERMIGEIGNYEGSTKEGKTVSVHGELWNAASLEELKLGEKVTIVSVNGLQLKVESIDKKNKEFIYNEVIMDRNPMASCINHSK